MRKLLRLDILGARFNIIKNYFPTLIFGLSCREDSLVLVYDTDKDNCQLEVKKK